MSERSEIRDAMADAIWAYATVSPRRARIVAPPAAKKAADDLIKLVIASNEDAFNKFDEASIDVLYHRTLEYLGGIPEDARATHPEDLLPHRFGDLVARSSLGVSLWHGVGLAWPEFYVDLNGDDLKWHGNVATYKAQKGPLRVRRVMPGAASQPRRPRRNPRKPHEVPHTKSLAEVRQLLGRRKQRCSRDCPGWAVFDTNRGFEIQTCDECNSLQVAAVRLSDDDVAQLPEAQKALREVVAENMEENPPTLSYANWCTELSKEAAKTGTRIAFGGETHDAWKRGLSPATYIRELGGWGPRHWKAPAGRPPGVPNPRKRSKSKQEDLERKIADNADQRKALIERLYDPKLTDEDVARIQHAISELENESSRLWSEWSEA